MPAAPAAATEGQKGSYGSEPAASATAGEGQQGSYYGSEPAAPSIASVLASTSASEGGDAAQTQSAGGGGGAAIEVPGATDADESPSLAPSHPPPQPPPSGTFAAATLPEAPSTNLLLAGSEASLHPPPPPPSAAAAVPATLPEAPSIDLLLGSDCTCLLLHIHHSGIPPVLKKLLESGSVRKAGLNITGDAHKLRTDFGLELGGLVELGSLANERCMVQVEGISLVLTLPPG